VIFAFAAPIIGVLACAGIDLAELSSDRSAMQDAADATALAMAKQLGIATASGITSRAQAFAAQELGPIASKDHLKVTTSIAPDNSSVTVALTASRSSFFGSLLPPGGWKLKAQATAATLGQLPLCVLSYGQAGGYNITMGGTSQLNAAKCLVQSNGNITVGGGAAIQSGLAQAVGTAKGSITPAPQTGAPPISDPFASLDISLPNLGVCSPVDVTYSAGVNFIAPGVHCGNMTVQNGATVQLLPGEHYFLNGALTLQNNAVLTGQDVVLVFDNHSKFTFADSSQVTLAGRTTGAYAGFVIVTTRTNTATFQISSTSARKLEGTIYIPAATLNVSGTGNIVDQEAAWTVVVAQSLQTSGSADLVINSAYATSAVPVPGGVGSSYASTAVTLKK